MPASTGSGGSLGAWVEVGKNGSGDLVVFTADDFDLILSDESVDGSVHPDFSESGAPLFFGFAVDLSFNGTIPNPPGFLNRGFNVDAIQITVISASSEEPSALPVPGLAPLGIGGLAVLFAAAGAATLRRIRRSGLPL